MSRHDRRGKGPAKVNFTSRWTEEELAWLEAEASHRTFEARMYRARGLQSAGAGDAEAIYTAHAATGTLQHLGPEVSMADVLHMAVDLYRSL